ncbi:MAG: hypothetical protein M1818_006944 [Claussenomyces sp. TS43310]|nr:MAG: hypothetical protein M1818_006944 [Claussenomyces sp. TS43310]
MRQAMKELGYVDTYHMMSASIENPPDCLLWRDAFAAKYDGEGTFGRREWDQLLGHCQAVCDWPAACFAKELIEAYPEAKVILTTRNVDSWHASTMRTGYWRATEPELRFLSYFDWAAAMYYPLIRRLFSNYFEDDFPNRGKQIFIRHYEEIRSIIPPERLLEFKVNEGWGPLCDFLKEPCPSRPFPHVNDTDIFVSRSRKRNRNQMYNVAIRWCIRALIVSVGIWALISVLRFSFAST